MTDQTRWGGVQRALDPFKKNDAPVAWAFSPEVQRWAGGGGYTNAGIDSIRALALGGHDSVTHPYAENEWVHICASIYADMASQVPMRLKVGDADDAEAPIIDSHPILDRLAAPNSMMSGEQLISAMVLAWLEDGDCFWFHFTPDGKPAPLAGVRRQLPEFSVFRGGEVQDPSPQDWRVSGPLMEVAQWRTNVNGKPLEWPVESVTQVRRFNPYSKARGMSLVSAMMRSIQNDFTSQRFDDALLENGGVPTFAFTTDRPLTPEQAEAQRQDWRMKNNKGQRDGEPLFLGKGTDVKALGLSPKDMEMERLRTWFRAKILSGFRVPEVLLGRESDSGFSRAGQREARKAFHEDAVQPILSKIGKQLTRGYIRATGDTVHSLYFDSASLTADSIDDHVERWSKVTAAGIKPGRAAELVGWDVEIDDEADTKAPLDLGGNLEQGPGSRVDAAGEDGTSTQGFDGAAYLKAFDDSLVPYDGRIKRVLAAIYREFLDHVVDKSRSMVARSITASDVDELIGSLEVWQREIKERVTPISAELFLEQSRGLIDELGILGLSSARLTQRSPAAIAFLSQKELRLVDTVGTLARDVKAMMLKSLDGGTDLRSALRERLGDVEKGLSEVRINIGSRAELIARTETTGVANGARVLTMAEAGVRTHRWVAVPDQRPERNGRPHWRTMNGERTRVGSIFEKNGLRWPGDTNGEAADVANCRCTTRADLIEIDHDDQA